MYWIYVVDKLDLNKLITFNNMSDDKYLTQFNENKNILCNHYILYYLIGSGKNTGFVGYSQTVDKLKRTNDLYSIFDDMNKNRYSIEVDNIYIFNGPVKLTMFAKNVPELDKKTIVNFRKKYMSKKNILIKFENYHNHIRKYIINVYNESKKQLNYDELYNESCNSSDDELINNLDNKSNESSNKSIESSNKSNKSNNKSNKSSNKLYEYYDESHESNKSSNKLYEYDDESHESNKSSNKLYEYDDESHESNKSSNKLYKYDDESYESNKSSNKLYESDDESYESYNKSDKSNNILYDSDNELVDHDSNSYDNKSDNDTCNDIYNNIYDNGIYYQIPILLCPCDKLKKYKFTDENKLIDEIIKHYQECGKCDITNNNKTDIFFGNANTKIYIEKVDSEDGDLINMMNCYDNCCVYKIKENEIRIIIIDDVTDLYNECIIIGWNKIEVI